VIVPPKYAALQMISRFQAELDRLFHEALLLSEGDLPAGDWQPDLDIVETPTSVLVLAEFPGFAPADIRIEVRGPRLVLSGTKPQSFPPPGEKVTFQRLERGQGRFVREIHLTAPVNTHHGTARLRDGLLTIEFPKIQDKRQEARVLTVEETGDSKA
jgi:HSP20 family molecular chaperone IbpA